MRDGDGERKREGIKTSPFGKIDNCRKRFRKFDSNVVADNE